MNPNRYAKIATCSLNQWALDFTGNKQRIMESIQIAKKEGCTLRIGPELEITGYSCEDHFLELDTITHSWEMLADILESDVTNDILCVIGMPLTYDRLMYNCSIFVLNKQIIFIKPKAMLAENGNSREGRYFTAWPSSKNTAELVLPEVIQKIKGQTTVLIGDALIQTKDTMIGIETQEEACESTPPSVQMGLEGVEIFLNNSALHHQIRELDTRIRIHTGNTQKHGGIYLYANQLGCDGGRLYFDGSCMIIANGNLLKIGSQFSLKEIEVISCVVDLDSITLKRKLVKNSEIQMQNRYEIKKINVDFKICKAFNVKYEELDQPLNLKDVVSAPEEEIAKGPACYLYNYLIRSGASGFFLPLSGGADSAAVAAVVYNMALLIHKGIKQKDEVVIQGFKKIVKNDDIVLNTPQEIMEKIFYTCYMKTTNNSSDTKQRADNLAKEIGILFFYSIFYNFLLYLTLILSRSYLL